MPTTNYICNVCLDAQNRIRFADIMDQKTVQCAVFLIDIAPNRGRSDSKDPNCSSKSNQSDVLRVSKRIKVDPDQAVDPLVPERKSFHATTNSNRIFHGQDGLQQNTEVTSDSINVELLPNPSNANHVGLKDTHPVSKRKGVDRDERDGNFIAARQLVVVPRSGSGECRSVSGASNTTVVGSTGQQERIKDEKPNYSSRKKCSDRVKQELRNSQKQDNIVRTIGACWKERNSLETNKTSGQIKNAVPDTEENGIENMIVSNIEPKEISASRHDNISSTGKTVPDGISITDSKATVSPGILHPVNNAAFCRSRRNMSTKLQRSNSKLSPCKLRNNLKSTISIEREARKLQSCKIKCALYRYIENVLSDGS